MSDHVELSQLAALLPLGTLGDEDERRIEAHLREGCAECEAALRGSAAVADELALAIEPVEPSPQLRARVLAHAAREARSGARARTRPPRRRSRLLDGLAALAAAAAALVVVGLGLEVRDQRRALDVARARTAELEERLTDATRESARLGRELTDAERVVSELTSEATRTVSLASTGALPNASARAFFDPDARRLVLVVYDLPPTPPGKTYQLWVIAGGPPISAGVFDVAEGGQARHEATALPSVSGPVTIAVTVEPAGGLPAPSTPPVLAGTGGI